MTESPEFEIAQFLRRLQWAALAVAVCWLVWMLAPVLTPFAFAALLAAGVVVRDMRAMPQLGDALRITVGSAEECRRVLSALEPAYRETAA